jgi:mono/diheme cytochrome c family protein
MLKREWNGLIPAVALVALTACGDAPRQDTAPAADVPPAAAAPEQPIGANVVLPEGVTLDMVQAGRRVFETTACFTCHGMDGYGTALGPTLRPHDWLNSDGSFEGIMGVVRNGVPQPVQYPAPMPAMGGAQLTDEQVRQVAAYVYVISRGG